MDVEQIEENKVEEERRKEEGEEKEGENKKTALNIISKPKRRSATDEIVEAVLLKRMKLTDFRKVNDKISKIMVPFTYGYDGSANALKMSKIGNRRMSQWNIESINKECSADIVQKSNIENSSNEVHEVREEQSGNLESSKDTQFIECLSLTRNLDVEINETNAQGFDLTDDPIYDQIVIEPKAKQITYRRKSARLSSSRDALGSIFSERNQTEIVDDDSIAKRSNHGEPTDEVNESRSMEPAPQHIQNEITSHAQTETNKSQKSEKLTQNDRQGFVSLSQLIARPRNDSTKLWQTRNNSISDPIFYCFDLVGKINTRTIKVACLMCDLRSEPLTCKVGSNSNLKAHLNRVSVNGH